MRSFYEDVVSGSSRVQQMIMGAGKTTVVGPLLTLLLADGQRLVTQVLLYLHLPPLSLLPFCLPASPLPWVAPVSIVCR